MCDSNFKFKILSLKNLSPSEPKLILFVWQEAEAVCAELEKVGRERNKINSF